MEKIPTLFLRDHDGDRMVRDEMTPGCEWVAAGEGAATRKWDGTCCMVRNGLLYRRHEIKPGKDAPPGFFEPADDPDPVTGKQPGWVPVGDGPEDRWHRDAFGPGICHSILRYGTYELVGPKINGNPENFRCHVLIRHGTDCLFNAPVDFAGLRDYLAGAAIEGIVWHHPDGRMAKIKRRDFGLPWPVPKRMVHLVGS